MPKGDRGGKRSGNFSNLKKIKEAQHEVYRGGDVKGIEQISIFTNDRFDREDIIRTLEGDRLNWKNKNEITQDELNNSPIAIMTYGSGTSFYIFKNKKEMDKVIKGVYGGYNQLGTLGKDYGFVSASGKGDFYLRRDKNAGGGFSWVNADGDKVSGYKGRKRQSDEAYKSRIRRMSQSQFDAYMNRIDKRIQTLRRKAEKREAERNNS